MYTTLSKIVLRFTTVSPTTGEPADATGTPTVASHRITTGGSLVAGPTFTVSKIAATTGQYYASAAVPEDAVADDVIFAIASAVVSGTTYTAAIGPADGIKVDPNATATAAYVWTSATRSLTDKAGFALTADYDAAKTALGAADYDAPPTASEIAAAVNTLAFDAGTVSASPTPTATVFAVSGATLNALDGGYAGMRIRFVDGALAGLSRAVQGHTYTGGVHTLTLATALPAAPVSGVQFELY